jgi:hypothetical protein
MQVNNTNIHQLVQDLAALRRKENKAWYALSMLLREVHYHRLYLKTHKSFERYCREHCGFGRAYAYHLIRAADVLEDLGLICSENFGLRRPFDPWKTTITK